MPRTSHLFLAMVAAAIMVSRAGAQQPSASGGPQPQQPQPQQRAQQLQPPADFQLVPAHQAWLDQVLKKWESDSSTVENFYCDFQRMVHNIHGPGDGRPFAKERGKLGYNKPDKGSFQITESLIWTPERQAPQPVTDPNAPQQAQPAKGDWKPRQDSDGNDVPGDHWVCNGKNVYQYKHHEKQLVVTPIPPEMQGKEIVNGPLPFLFGAETDKLKQRYWLRPDPQLSKGTFIGIHAKPKFQEDAANYSDVWVVLRNEPQKLLMPAGIRVRHPDGSWDEYRFNLSDAQVNGRLAGLFAKLFQEPRTPWGWKRVEEPMRQAQQQQPTQR